MIPGGTVGSDQKKKDLPLFTWTKVKANVGEMEGFHVMEEEEAAGKEESGMPGWFRHASKPHNWRSGWRSFRKVTKC